MQTQVEMENEEVEVTLMVSECGEFHNLGEFYENIPTVEDAIAIWKQIPPERMQGIPAIGINVHRPAKKPIWMTKLICYLETELIWRY